MPLITVASISLAGWTGNSSGVSLRLYCNADFTAESGAIHLASKRDNPPSLGTFYQSFPCTVSSGSLVIPEIEIDSTVDSPDNAGATYSAFLWDGSSGLPIQRFGTSSEFSVSAITPTTWPAIFTSEVTE